MGYIVGVCEDERGFGFRVKGRDCLHPALNEHGIPSMEGLVSAKGPVQI